MLEVAATLPPGALAPEGQALTQSVAKLNGHWWRSERALVQISGGAITSAAPRAGHLSLRPASDNDGAAHLMTHLGIEVIAGTSGIHSGLASEARLDCETLGLIVVFAATEPERQTLVALQSDGAKSTAVLSLIDGVLVLKDRKSDQGLDLQLRGTGPAVAFLQFGPGEMALSRDGHVFATTATGDAFAPGGIALLLGCVRERAGLSATLGPHRIADVIALPNIDLRSPDHAMLRAGFRSYAAEIFADVV